jgi:hypothetical protein
MNANIFPVLLLAACALTTLVGQARAADPVHKQVIVIGVPKRVKFLADATRDVSDDELFVANEYSVVLDRVRKIAGDAEVPRRLRLKLLATHAEVLAGQALIAVVLEVDAGTFKARYWEVVSRTVCIPLDLLAGEPPDEGVYVSYVGDLKCLKFNNAH